MLLVAAADSVCCWRPSLAATECWPSRALSANLRDAYAGCRACAGDGHQPMGSHSGQRRLRSITVFCPPGGARPTHEISPWPIGFGGQPRSAMEPLTPGGHVLVEGEIWSAVALRQCRPARRCAWWPGKLSVARGAGGAAKAAAGSCIRSTIRSSEESLMPDLSMPF